MNPFEFVIAIILITTIGQIIRTKQMGKYGMKPRGLRGLRKGLILPGHDREDEDDWADRRENDQLREEVKLLKDRIQTLERIAVDKENSLANEIELLRDRRD